MRSMIELKMPSLVADMEAATLVEWFKQPGDHVQRGDIIALAETQRGAIEIEVFDEGIIGEQRVQPGREVPVGTVLATIFGLGEAASPLRIATPQKPVEGRPYSRRGSGRVPIAPARSVHRTPANARSMSGNRLSPGFSAGDDGDGVTEAPSEQEPTRDKMARRDCSALDLDEMRKAISAAMVQSHRDIPHYWVAHAIDATPLFDWLDTKNARRPIERPLLYIAPLMKAVALALKEVPELNGHYEEGIFRPSPAVHVGFATPLRGGGLVAPAIRDADSMSVGKLMKAIADLAARARLGRLRSSEMTDVTVTLSNLCEGNADSVFPLIYPPQVATVGCGTAGPRPWILGDTVSVRQVIPVTLAGDHRVNHSWHAAAFHIRRSYERR
jgi:pyruvate dehydrogenase E2 component (dihydrolipoamide acetyltransferase)